jgi:DNA-binding transcriptional ArsR family regulator
MSQHWPSGPGEGGESHPDDAAAGVETERDDGRPVSPRAVRLDSDDAGTVIASLSSETARSIVVDLRERPATASEVADAVDTSVQNARHHLQKLTDAGVVEVVETRYSPKGREMDVYAPADGPLVMLLGDDTQREEGFVDSLRRFLGAVGVLAAGSLLVQWLVERRVAAATGGDGGVSRVPDAVGGGDAALAPFGVPPGALFFAGGALVLVVVSAWRVYVAGTGPR